MLVGQWLQRFGKRQRREGKCHRICGRSIGDALWIVFSIVADVAGRSVVAVVFEVGLLS